ncbi:MAG: hypothetical protein SF187_05765 [Deltaproteobacteria bacterium]|nr:hypothetical protein [Deltaproteobacteria bacterium]
MRTKTILSLAVAALLPSLSASADTLWVEAESVRAASSEGGNSITSPLRIEDAVLASDGSLVKVPSGLNSLNAPPATGIARYHIELTNAGVYGVYGRVKAPDTTSDSLWVRFDGGTWVRWMDIALGSAWHWDFVHDSVNGDKSAVTFNLTAGAHDFDVAYRENNVQLDALVFTDNPNYSPTAFSSPLAAPVLSHVSGSNRIRFTWTAVAGATSYQIEKQQASGAFSSVQNNSNLVYNAQSTGCFRVVPVRSGYTGTPSQVWCSGFASNNYPLVIRDGYGASYSSPMFFDWSDEEAKVFPGYNSLNAAPDTGYARFDFQLGATTKVKFWVLVTAPSTSSDSFWVRIDHGTWIKWDNIVGMGSYGWADVRDSGASNAVVQPTLSAGSHTLEFAYREEGTTFSRILVESNLSTEPPGGVYD